MSSCFFVKGESNRQTEGHTYTSVRSTAQSRTSESRATVFLAACTHRCATRSAYRTSETPPTKRQRTVPAWEVRTRPSDLVPILDFTGCTAKNPTQDQMAPLRTLDLFSGIGGMTLALRGIAQPVAYCDSSAAALAVIQDNVRAARLPPAPMCEDVRLMGRAWLRRHGALRPNLLIAGFPCTGFSIAGLRDGFRNAESGLFFEILRITDELRPRMILLENSDTMPKLGLDVIISELNVKRGYELRWCVVAASDLGAPHVRRRWFCLAIRRLPDSSLLSSVAYRRFRWVSSREPKRTACTLPLRVANRRFALIGNSVVPDVVRAAFVYLIGGFRDANIESRVIPCRRDCNVAPWAGPRLPRSGSVSNGTVYKAPPLPKYRAHDMTIVLSPRSFKTDKTPSARITTGVLAAPLQKTHWATPSFTNIGPNNYLTARGTQMLHTQVRFERETADRQCVVSPRWASWLMGFPGDWVRR